MVWIGMIAGAGAVGLLRLAWSLATRSVPILCVAWGLLLVGLIMGGVADGAWGLALVALAAMGMACAFLAFAVFTSPGNSAVVAERPSVLPERRIAARDLHRRGTTFLLTVPASMIATLLVGLAARVVAGWAGWSEANANVLALFLAPTLWSILLFLMLMASRRAVQGLTLLVPALVSGAILVVDSVL